MRFNCGLSASERYAIKLSKKLDWHPFFCLLPRRVGLNDCRWLEWIERKGTMDCWYDGIDWSYEYRPREVFYG